MTITEIRPTSPAATTTACNHGPVVLAQPKAWLNVALTRTDPKGRRVWCDQCLRSVQTDETGTLLEVDC
ncbi:MAG: hypothetical protein ACXVKN_11440 [Acidimicrobiia bacterium]